MLLREVLLFSSRRTKASRLRQELERQFGLISDAVQSGDEGALARAMEPSLIPEEARERMLDVYSGAGSSDVAEAAFLASLRQRFEQQALELTAQAQQGAAQAFTEAITRVYFYVLFMVAAGWLVTVSIPELPLAKIRPIPGPAAAAD
jgi:hypothetical protein